MSKTNKISVLTEENMIGYTGSTPFIMFDENWNQMSLDNEKTIIPREHTTRMFPLAYLAGKLSVLKQSESFKLLLIIILITSIAAAALGGYSWYNSNVKLTDATAKIDNVNTKIDNTNNLLESIVNEYNITETEIVVVG